MSVIELGEATYAELERLDKTHAVVLLPVGATEAHGPHLPLATDVIIANAMAREGARLLSERGATALIAPPVAYTCAGYAAGFAGTVSISPEVAEALYVDIGKGLARHGFRALAIANAHLEPSHIGSLTRAAARLREETALTVAYPDVTRKPWALRLTDEFKSGACHAGQYEGSVVLAERPDLVRQDIARRLKANPASLSVAIREGKTTFEQAGGPQAYFGAPAGATAEEGRATIATLGAIVLDALLEAGFALPETR